LIFEIGYNLFKPPSTARHCITTGQVLASRIPKSRFYRLHERANYLFFSCLNPEATNQALSFRACRLPEALQSLFIHPKARPRHQHNNIWLAESHTSAQIASSHYSSSPSLCHKVVSTYRMQHRRRKFPTGGKLELIHLHPFAKRVSSLQPAAPSTGYARQQIAHASERSDRWAACLCGGLAFYAPADRFNSPLDANRGTLGIVARPHAHY
jgi:hypothetical protein